MNPIKDSLVELRADGTVAVLTFETGATSKLTKKFVSELQTLVAVSTKKQPLVYMTDRSLSVVYRSVETVVYLLTEQGSRIDYSGRRFADGPSGYIGSIGLTLTTDAAELPAGGTWADDRNPENTPRFTLPVFDADAMGLALVALFDKWTDAGHIVEIKRPARVGWRPDVAEEIDLRDPADYDDADPRRYMAGAAEHADKVRQMRRERGLRNAGE